MNKTLTALQSNVLASLASGKINRRQACAALGLNPIQLIALRRSLKASK